MMMKAMTLMGWKVFWIGEVIRKSNANPEPRPKNIARSVLQPPGDPRKRTALGVIWMSC